MAPVYGRKEKVMKLIIRVLFAAGFILIGAASGFCEDLYYGGYDGTWDGKLKIFGFDLVTHSEELNSADDLDVRLQIKGTSARVFIQDDGKWSEVKSRQFRIVVDKTNAVIFATDSSSDVYDKTGSGGWVETWSFTLTHKDAATLYVAWTRSVNNYLRPPWRDRRGVPHIHGGFGEISRQQ
jgi:hypothetical protein